MATAGGSGTGDSDRGSSRGKGKTPVGPHDKSKKPGVWVKAQLHFLKKTHEECVARDEEPGFDLEDLLRRYGPSPPNTAPPSSAPEKNISEHRTFPPKDG